MHVAMRDSIIGRVPVGGGWGGVGTGSALIMGTPLYAHAIRPARTYSPGRAGGGGGPGLMRCSMRTSAPVQLQGLETQYMTNQ